MIAVAALALGLVLIVEGLAYVLAPWLVEDLLRALQALPVEQRRMLGLIALAAGVFLVWIGKNFGA